LKLLPEHKILQKKFTLQQDQSDCGVACLLSLIKHYGGYNTLENLRKLSGTNITGTTLLGLYQAANQTGFTADGCESDMEGLINHKQPCILHVIIENKLEHYVVFFGTDPLSPGVGPGVRFIIGDPAKGIIYLTQTELEEIWKSKTFLVLEPNENFRKAKDIKHEKRKWTIDLIKNDYPLLAIAAGLGVAVVALSLVMAIFSQRLIDEILPKKEFTKLYLGISLVFFLLMIKEGLSVLRQYFLIRQGKDFNIRIIDFFYHHLLRLPKSFFDTRKIGEFTARLTDTSRIQRVISQLAGNTAIDGLMVIVSTVFIFVYSWQAGIGCLVAMPCFYMLIYFHNKKIIEGQRNIMVSYAMAESNYISTLQGIEPIKNSNKQELFSTTNKNIYETFQNNIFSLGTIQIKISFLANVFGVVFIIAVLTFLSICVLQGHLKTGELIAVLTMLGSLLPSVARLALISIPINEAKIAFDRMFEFTGIEPEKEEETIKEINFQSLKVQNLSFRFAGRSRLLQNVNLEICKGQIIALMGENGCGKSTLSQILQKYYLPESGEIIINGTKNLKEISFQSWRNVIGIVPQNIHIFNGTVLENIAFDDVVKNPKAIADFLQEYGFASFIESLPQSYMTLVGEEGINLSGGQKQMIAFARALYHHPQLLILDEATAAMDRQSEQFVLHLLQKLKREMGVIFITHRLHILKSFCDKIYILEKGTITAKGNHHQLLESQNLYSSYWNDMA
jgi:ABC-type bacteriocin/lantibiotic exporter with double-glycine peptidase domain